MSDGENILAVIGFFTSLLGVSVLIVQLARFLFLGNTKADFVQVEGVGSWVCVTKTEPAGENRVSKCVPFDISGLAGEDTE